MNDSAPAPKRRWWMKALLALGILALVGFAVFAGMLWSWTEFERMDADSAMRAFDEAHRRAGGGEAYLELPDSGDVVVRRDLEKEGDWRILGLHGLVWQADRERLVRFDVPGWFVRTKMRASISFESFVRSHGVDWSEAEVISTEDLARFGQGVVLDRGFADGGRVMVWQEAERR